MSSLLKDARLIFDAAVRSVQADRLLFAFDLAAHLPLPSEAYGRVVVLGAGKAAMAMAGAVEAKIRVDEGLVVVPHGYRATLPSSQLTPEIIEVVEAGHPVPDTGGEEAAARVLDTVRDCTENDLVIVLLSGGGSALWPAPAYGLTLGDVQEVNRLLLGSGATIHQVNAIRKHLSRIKGGRLAMAARPATIVALVLSDVVGNDLSVIASGPTMPDPSTLAEAVSVLRQFDLWEVVPAAVRDRLKDPDAETPKPGDPVFSRVETCLIGSNRTALAATRAEAEQRGYAGFIVEENVTGEAREVGRRLARQVLDFQADRPSCLLWGGETTVTVTSEGKGGRNQEVALAAALEFEGAAREIVFLSGGTDGIDGPTDAAGAWATPETIRLSQQLGLHAARHLAKNDAYPFFGALDALLRPGPTHTNVMDIQIALIRPG